MSYDEDKTYREGLEEALRICQAVSSYAGGGGCTTCGGVDYYTGAVACAEALQERLSGLSADPDYCDRLMEHG